MQHDYRQIAVIIVTFFSEALRKTDIVHLEACLFSLTEWQRVKPAEVIIVDDMSTPQMAEKVQAISAKYGARYAYYWRKPKRFRMTNSLNIGLALTQSPVVFTTTDDTLYSSKTLEIMGRLHTQYKNLIVSTHRPELTVDWDNFEWRHFFDDETEEHTWSQMWNDSKVSYDENVLNKIDEFPLKLCPFNFGQCDSFRREHYYAWDNDLTGWGPDDEDKTWQLRKLGLYPVVFREAVGYHMLGTHGHDNQFTGGSAVTARVMFKQRSPFTQVQPVKDNYAKANC